MAEERSRQEEEARRLEAEQVREKEELALWLAEEEQERLEREEVEHLQKQVCALPQPSRGCAQMNGVQSGCGLPQPGALCTGAGCGAQAGSSSTGVPSQKVRAAKQVRGLQR